MIRSGRSRQFAEGMATPSAIEDNWQNETGLRVTLKGAQLGQIAHLCESRAAETVDKTHPPRAASLVKVPPGQWRYLRGNERFCRRAKYAESVDSPARHASAA
jgi:hypothetical protein